MVSIGGCDWCGEFCSQLSVVPPDYFALASGWVPPSRIERHCDLVNCRIECVPFDGDMLGLPAHIGPWHARDGSPNTHCQNCFDDTQMDLGEWVATLDHTECPECWKDVAGARVLIERIRPLTEEAGTGHKSRQQRAAAIGNPMASTEPADRARAESAIRDYLGGDVINIRWVPSPVAVVQALTKALDETDLDPEPNGSGPRWSLWELPRGYEDRVTPLIRDVPGEIASTSGTVGAALSSAIVEASAAKPDVAALLWDAGQFDPRAASLALTSIPKWIPKEVEQYLDLLIELSQSAGPVVVLADQVLISERPLVLKLDDAGRLHSERGPAIAYGDGLAVYAWHGIPVAPWLIEEPERITIAKIDGTRNVELRRVMIERFGAERLVREGNAELVHEDDTGRLWRRRISPDDWNVEEPIVMVEVLNSTPERDGSRKTYFLRVPPRTRTAREAVALTFGAREPDYRPARET